MQPPTSLAFESAWLAKVCEPLLASSSSLRIGTPTRSSTNETAEHLLSLLTSGAVRKGSLEQMQFVHCRQNLLNAIQRCVSTNQPLQLTLMAFPFKVPNPAKVGPRRLPDLAELAALVRLHRLNAKVKSVYPAGMEIHILHDGSYIAAIFGVPLEEVRAYESYFSRMVASFGEKRCIHLHDFQSLLPEGALGRHALHVRKSIRPRPGSGRESGAWSDCFRRTFGMMNLRGLPLDDVCNLMDCAETGRLPSEHHELERKVRIAMLRYELRDSLLHRLDPRPTCFPDAIHATTRCRPRRLAIWMVERGRSLLPWHGVGVVDRTGRWRVTLSREVAGNRRFRPVFLNNEDTPFFYRQVA